MNDGQLEKELLSLAKIVEGLQNKVLKMEEMNYTLLRANNQLLEYIEQNQSFIDDYERNAIFEILDSESYEKKGFWYPKIVGVDETVEKIVRERVSMARFGDGEFSIIDGIARHRFQTTSIDRLGKRLKEVLDSDNPQIIIGIANNYGNLDCYSEQAKHEIRRYMNCDVRRQHLSLLKKENIYYDTYITRPYVMYADSMTDAPQKRFNNLKRIWDKRKCVFVEGCMTGLGVGNDLFDNTEDIKRILVPAENAFDRYDEILAECKKQDMDVLFLIAAGPTATVLAYDLCNAGYQAIDIGHIDLEYEWFLKGEGRRVLVDGKYSNEMPGQEVPENKISDPVYLKQIISNLSI